MIKHTLKRITPTFLWEGMKKVRDAYSRRRLRRKMLVPWTRRLLLPTSFKRALSFVEDLPLRHEIDGKRCPEKKPNPLRDYAQKYTVGPGFWKWDHYYDIYHRHLQKYVGSPVNVCEVGIFSGGSIDMWLSYFGDGCHVYGVDLEPACKNYERSNVTIKVGDQEDATFWRQFQCEVPRIDVLIDDGGHTPQQQIVTLEQMLPFLSPGGVFICEDVYGINNRFSSYAAALIDRLNAKQQKVDAIGVEPTGFQSMCHSIHFYPYIVVIEKYASPPSEFICPKRGTEWSPFYHHPS